MAVVIFDQARFLDRYPEFKKTLTKYPTSAVNCFSEAELFLDNSNGGRVPVPPRDLFLNMITAHIMVLNYGRDGQKPSGVVGRIKSAGQGSVNVQAEMDSPAGSQAWWNQTQYGASYWQASKPYKLAFYVPPPGRGQFFLNEEG